MRARNSTVHKQELISDISAGIFLIVSVVVLFLPVFLSWRGIFHNDQVVAEFSRHFFLARALQSGTLPLWQPNIWCGAIPYYSFPYGGDCYYFLLWPFYLLSDLNNLDSAYWTISILPLFLHYVIAAFGMYGLLRRVVGCNRFAAYLGAFAYIFSPAFTYTYVCLYTLIMQAWLPWLILVYVMAVRDFKVWRLLSGAVIFALICLGSKPNFIPYIFIVWSGFVIVLVAEKWGCDDRKGAFKALFVAFLIFIPGILLSAPYLYSFLDGLRYTDLGFKLTFDKAMENPAGSLLPSYLATLFVPDLFGSITGVNFIFSRLMFWYANMSAGTIVTFTALIGALFSFGGLFKKKPISSLQKYAILGLAFYALAVLCSLGKNAPFCKWIAGWVPIFSGLPNPIRFRFVQCFATSLLIGIGMHYLSPFENVIQSLKLRKIVWLYVIFSASVVGLVLFLPHRTASSHISTGAADFKIDGFLPLGQAVGTYTPRMSRTQKVKVMFDGASEGEIRYSDNHAGSPQEGNLARAYHVFDGGFSEFDVDIPPNSFLWIYPRSGAGRIGYWEGQQGSFRYERSWGINAYRSSLSLFQDATYQNASLFVQMKNSYPLGANPLLKPLVYWVCALFVIILGVYLIPLRGFIYFLGTFVLLEFSVFGFMAFYGCTFNEDTTRLREFLPHNVRVTRPVAHPLTQLMMEKQRLVVPDNKRRIATDYPFCDNYSYLSNNFSFMGEPAFPLEKRFKRAVDAAYERNMTVYIFYEAERVHPKKSRLLSNFSVGYFLSRDSREIFPHESIVPLAHGGVDHFVHINQDAVPRVYVMDTFIPASDDRQLQELLSGDLRRAVYAESFGGLVPEKKYGKDYMARFNDMQSGNPVTYMNYDNPNQVVVEVAVSRASMLVLTEVWYPGWEATVDGKRVPIYRVNYCQRGIPLEKGAHRVSLRFKPPAWRIGIGISLGTLILMPIGLFVFRRRITNWMKCS